MEPAHAYEKNDSDITVCSSTQYSAFEMRPSTAMNCYLFEEGCREVPALDSHISQHPLLIGFLQNVLLHSALTYQPENKQWNNTSAYLLDHVFIVRIVMN